MTTATISNYGTAPATKRDSLTNSPSPSQTPTQSQSISASYGLGSGDTSGISASEVKPPTSFSDLIMNGGVAAGIGLLLTVAILYFITLRRRNTLQNLQQSQKTTTATKPLPPSSLPPIHARHDFDTTSKMITNPLLSTKSKTTTTTTTTTTAVKAANNKIRTFKASAVDAGAFTHNPMHKK